MATSETTPLLVFSPAQSERNTVVNETCFVDLGSEYTAIEIADAATNGNSTEAADTVSNDSVDFSTFSSTAGSDNAAAAKTEEGMSDLRALMTVIKGNMGTGILAMPFAVSCAGLAVGPLFIIMMGCIALCCMHFLLRSSRIQRARAEAAGEEGVDMNYPNLIAWTLKTAHPCLAGWPALWASRFVIAFMTVTQLGVCSVYIVFIAASIKEVVYARTSVHVHMMIYQLSVAVPLMLYSQIRSLKKMTPVSVIANILTVIGLVIVFLNFFSGQLPDVSARPAFAGWSMMPAFLGTVVFSFEGISLVLPMENQVRNKRLYSAPYGVVSLSMAIITLLYAAMGFFGYLAYGPDTQASITLNLPDDPWYYCIAKLVFAAVMFLSYHLQLYVPVQLVMTWLSVRNDWNRDDKKKTRHKAEAVVRALLFTLTFVISIAVPDLDVLISLVGAVASSFLALILPALIYLLTLMTQPQRPHVAVIVFLVFIMVLGFLGFVIGTYTSIIDIIQKY